MDLTKMGLGHVAGPCQCRNGHSGSIKVGNLLIRQTAINLKKYSNMQLVRTSVQKDNVYDLYL